MTAVDLIQILMKDENVDKDIVVIDDIGLETQIEYAEDHTSVIALRVNW